MDETENECPEFPDCLCLSPDDCVHVEHKLALARRGGRTCEGKPSGLNNSGDELDIPTSLRRCPRNTWGCRITEPHTQCLTPEGVPLENSNKPLNVRERAPENEKSEISPLPPDLRAEEKRVRSQKRIAKMKAGLERKALDAAGVTAAMPLSGKEALQKIKNSTPRRKQSS